MSSVSSGFFSGSEGWPRRDSQEEGASVVNSMPMGYSAKVTLARFWSTGSSSDVARCERLR